MQRHMSNVSPGNDLKQDVTIILWNYHCTLYNSTHDTHSKKICGRFDPSIFQASTNTILMMFSHEIKINSHDYINDKAKHLMSIKVNSLSATKEQSLAIASIFPWYYGDPKQHPRCARDAINSAFGFLNHVDPLDSVSNYYLDGILPSQLLCDSSASYQALGWCGVTYLYLYV